MKGKKKGFSVGMERRASHVNRTFHETISQIIANGELGVYLDITEVKFTRFTISVHCVVTLSQK